MNTGKNECQSWTNFIPGIPVLKAAKFSWFFSSSHVVQLEELPGGSRVDDTAWACLTDNGQPTSAQKLSYAAPTELRYTLGSYVASY